jgi:hypothetical protein
MATTAKIAARCLAGALGTSVAVVTAVRLLFVEPVRSILIFTQLTIPANAGRARRAGRARA